MQSGSNVDSGPIQHVGFPMLNANEWIGPLQKESLYGGMAVDSNCEAQWSALQS